MIRDLSSDFVRFLDELAAGAEAWTSYRKHYLDRHRPVIDALREQVLGIDWPTWRDRVERVKPGDYGGLRAILAGTEVAGIAAKALHRCRQALPCGRLPDVYLVVGFFSPDAFLIRLGDRWQIAVGLERLRGSKQVPLLVAHEYGHWARRRLRPQEPDTLAERMASEGISIVLTRQLYPSRPLAEHFGVHRSRLNALQEAETAGWQAIAPHLNQSDQRSFQSFLSGVGPDRGLPPRIGVYLGYRAARALQRRCGLALPDLARSPVEAFFAAKGPGERV